MKVILYMAITPNGYIAKENDSTPWSDEEWESFTSMVTKIKNLVVGRKTFDIMQVDGDLQEIGNPFTVVVSRKACNAANFVNSPEQALKFLKENGFKEALIAGGAGLNSAFLKRGLIDEIYLDIEPVLFGKGVKLFADADFEAKLDLLEVKRLSKNLVQLHYSVLR